MKTVAVIQARMSSTRLPGKVLLELGGLPVLERCVRAARKAALCDAVVVATSTAAEDDAVATWCTEKGIAVYRGPLEDVLARVHAAAASLQADFVVRLTADCPLLDPDLIDQTIYLLKSTGSAYASMTHPSTWPDGLDVEAMTFAALDDAFRQADLPSEREHVTRWIRANRSRYPARTLICPLPGLQERRWTLDTSDDLTRLETLVGALEGDGPHGYMDVVRIEDELLRAKGETARLNALRNSSLSGALLADQEWRVDHPRSFARSNTMIDRVEARIPSASQTFSKSRLILPEGKAPLFLSHGLGCRVWDIDGNEYVDMISALLAVSLGYCDPDVDEAVRAQMSNCVSISLATELEYELAETLARLIPGAEAVRYGKNGSDATSGAVRLARAYTGRDRVIAVGYHGWQDWYIGSTVRNKGVPQAVSRLTRRIPSGDLNEIEDALRGNDVACIMLEPVYPSQEAGRDYLTALKALAERHGTLMVLDETVTGFRTALGGAGSYYGVTPHMATFGKGMANGYPLSCVVGEKRILQEANHVFLSSTFGGETVSLTAALATIRKMQQVDAIAHIWKSGAYLSREVNQLIQEAGLENIVSLKGIAPWMGVSVADHPNGSATEIRTFLMKEMMGLGMLITGSHNVNYAHDIGIMKLVVRAYARVLPKLADLLKSGKLAADLDCKIVQPIFQVRSTK